MGFLNSKMFLTLGGIALLLIGVLGFIGVIGPTPQQSIFGSAWYFDNIENWVHTLLGVAALAIVGLKLKELYQPVTLLVGVAALFFGVLNFFLPSSMPNIGAANLESPADTILHLGVGIWALVSWKMSMKGAPATGE
jgi:hypothetical protein